MSAVSQKMANVELTVQSTPRTAVQVEVLVAEEDTTSAPQLNPKEGQVTPGVHDERGDVGRVY
jgi:hypothetical protein